MGRGAGVIAAVVFHWAEVLTLRGVDLADQWRGLAPVLVPDDRAPNAGR